MKKQTAAAVAVLLTYNGSTRRVNRFLWAAWHCRCRHAPLCNRNLCCCCCHDRRTLCSTFHLLCNSVGMNTTDQVSCWPTTVGSFGARESGKMALADEISEVLQRPTICAQSSADETNADAMRLETSTVKPTERT